MNAVEGCCYGNDHEDDETMPPGQDENAEGKSTVSVAVDAKGVLAMADNAPPTAETQSSQTTARSKNAWRESRRVAASKKKATSFRDEPTLRQAMACIHKERWLEAMLDELTSLSEHGMFELCELLPGYKPAAGKWVLKIKRGVQCEIEQFKARYVAKGFTQVHGVREYVELDETIVKWIGTKEMLADGFTKVCQGLHLLILGTSYKLRKFESCGGML